MATLTEPIHSPATKPSLSPPKPVLLYTSFGPGPHIEEILFSASSALLKCKNRDAFRLVIFTDDPRPFESLEADLVTIDQTHINEWLGSYNYLFRRKICAIAAALRKFDAPVVVVDGDTYFRKPPEELFNRISPGHALMHLHEGRIGHLVALGPQRAQLAALKVQTTDGNTYQFHPDSQLWNAGIIGLHPADVECTDRTLHLCDAISKATSNRISEQIAFTEILSKNTTLHPCQDVIFHYHERFMRDPFRASLPSLLEQTTKLPLAQRPQWLYTHRPKPPLRKKLVASIKRRLKPFGLFKSDLNTSI
jgi:hypothetical protein